jgi:hypothetical protein
MEREREKMAPPNRLYLRPSLLSLTLKLSMINWRLSLNDFLFQFYMPCKMYSRTPGSRPLALSNEVVNKAIRFAQFRFLFVAQDPTGSFPFPISYEIRFLKSHLRTQTNFMELRPCWEAASCVPTHELPKIVSNHKVHYRVHKSLIVSSWATLTQSIPRSVQFSSQLFKYVCSELFLSGSVTVERNYA